MPRFRGDLRRGPMMATITLPVDVDIKLKLIYSLGARVLHFNPKISHLTSLPGRERLVNLPKCKTHVQGVQSFSFC